MNKHIFDCSSVSSQCKQYNEPLPGWGWNFSQLQLFVYKIYGGIIPYLTLPMKYVVVLVMEASFPHICPVTVNVWSKDIGIYT